MKHQFTILSVLFLISINLAASDTIKTKKKYYKPKEILTTVEKVADWQLNSWKEKGMAYPKWDWTNAAGYVGLYHLGTISKKTDYHDILLSIGKELKWNTGPERFYADDYCIGYTYSKLSLKHKDPQMIARFRLLADSIVAQPHTESLEWKNDINHREWAWCDALFMGPPALSMLSVATQDPKYLDITDKLWWKTYDYLYDKEEHLYFRDGSNFTKRENNGSKVFWSRGNGWVMAGLALLLENMPDDYPTRAKYIALYEEMAAKIASIQQPDGSWHTSLLDPARFDVIETSGTGFYTYAILWGLNNGILDKATYSPVAVKAWKALESAIQPNGMLGYVQPIGWQPAAATKESTAIFGVGAFLLAGTEMYKYTKKSKISKN